MNLIKNTEEFEQHVDKHYSTEWLSFCNVLEVSISEPIDANSEETDQLVQDWLDMFLIWTPDGSISKFIKLMQMKGVSKGDQAPFREQLAKRVPSKSSSLSIAINTPSGEIITSKDVNLPSTAKSMSPIPGSSLSQSKLNQNFSNFFKGMNLLRDHSSTSGEKN